MHTRTHTYTHTHAHTRTNILLIIHVDEQDVQSPNEQKITSPVIHSEPPPTAAVATTGPSVKSPSGYHMGVAMGGGGAERCGPTLPLPSSKELLEVRQRKKVRDLCGEEG